MSWSLGTTLKHEHTSEGLKRNRAELLALDRGNIGNDYAAGERNEQIDASIRAVFQVISEAGFVNAEEISVSLSGHANPEHKKDPRTANEHISITVSILKYREVEAVSEEEEASDV